LAYRGSITGSGSYVGNIQREHAACEAKDEEGEELELNFKSGKRNVQGLGLFWRLLPSYCRVVAGVLGVFKDLIGNEIENDNWRRDLSWALELYSWFNEVFVDGQVVCGCSDFVLVIVQ
jgi:hypothetical protein